MVLQLCIVLEVPPPPVGNRLEPVSKKPRTDVQDVGFERAVHVFCLAWQRGVEDRVRRYLDMSRAARVWHFVTESYTPERMSIIHGESVAVRVMTVPAVRAMLTPTADVVERCALVDRGFLIQMFRLMEKNLCIVDSNLGAVSMYPAAPWESAAPPYYLPQQPEVDWFVVLHWAV